MDTHDSSRRRFLAQVVTAAVATLALDAMASQAAPATAKLPKLPLDNPQAKALAYTENVATVKHPLYKSGRHCDDCNFYKGVQGQAYGPSQMFPQYSVAAHGWCSAWAKKV
jgi:hypothetical protein